MLHARLGIAEENSGKLVILLRREAKKTAEEKGYSTLLTDGSPGIGCPVISSIGGASLVIIVTEPTVSGVHDMERVISLTEHFRIPAALVVNKADVNRRMQETIERVARQRGVEILGAIPYDPAVTQAMVQARTVVEYDHGPASRAIMAIGSRVAERMDISQNPKRRTLHAAS